MNEKIWARTNRPIKNEGCNYDIKTGAFVRIMPWIKQREYKNVQIEYITDTGHIGEIFVKEAWVEPLTKDEIRLLNFFFEPW